MAKKLQLPDGPVYDSSGNIVGFGKQRFNQPISPTMQNVTKRAVDLKRLAMPLDALSIPLPGSQENLTKDTLYSKNSNPSPPEEWVNGQKEMQKNIDQFYNFSLQQKAQRYGEVPSRPEEDHFDVRQTSVVFPKWDDMKKDNSQQWVDLLKPDTSGLEKFGGDVKEVLRRLIFGQPKSQVATSSIPQVLAAQQQTATPTPTPTQAPNPTPTPPPDKSALPYFEAINNSAKEKNIPQDILYRVLRKESMGFNPDVINGNIKSPAGAMGIAQFMPKTAEGIGLDPLNPDEAIPAAAKYLAAKFKEFGSWELALAAYNAGGGTVYDYMNGTNKTGGNPNHLITGGVPPYQETENYVKSILEGLDI